VVCWNSREMYVRTYVDINTSFPRIPIKMVSMTPSYMILRKCEQDIPIAAKSCKNMDGTIKNIDVWSPVTAIDVLKKNSLFTQRGLALQRPNSALATFRWKWTSNPSFIQVAHYCGLDPQETIPKQGKSAEQWKTWR